MAERQSTNHNFVITDVAQKTIAAYLRLARTVRDLIPADLRKSVRISTPGRAYGRHLNALVRRAAKRRQGFGTFFLRNRPELQLLCRLLEHEASGASVSITVLGCSSGAEVYSVLWSIRSARADLKLQTHAVDISEEILQFAERGTYPRRGRDASIFERMTDEEMESLFDVDDEQASVKPSLKEGIIWLAADAGDSALAVALAPQDIVLANRFLCHMEPPAAERCLRNIARLVKPGGYLFVSGVDVDVRTKIAREMGWRPVMELMREIHEGDPSLRKAWPSEYWGLEPFRSDRPDWKLRYASVFQLGESGTACALDPTT